MLTFVSENVSAIIVYDNIHGGLGPANPIARDLKSTAARLASTLSTNALALHQLNEWLQRANSMFLKPSNPGPSGWRRTFRKGAHLQFTSGTDSIAHIGPPA